MAERKRNRSPSEIRAADKKRDEEARAVVDAERASTRKKTERLKALRLAKEASDNRPGLQTDNPTLKPVAGLRQVSRGT
jgi:hypothetical protein